MMNLRQLYWELSALFTTATELFTVFAMQYGDTKSLMFMQTELRSWSCMQGLVFFMAVRTLYTADFMGIHNPP